LPPVRGYDLPGGKLLSHSLAVAVGAEELARMLGHEVPSHVFTAGLLHDIGKIVLGTFLEVDAGPVLERANSQQLPFDVAEREVLGIDHAEVGGILLDRWNFPVQLVASVRCHHRPEDLSPPDFVADCVHVSNMVSIECGLGAGIDGLHYTPSGTVLRRLGITGEMIEKLTCTMLTELNGVQDALCDGTERG
jgi:putative nucleotidyltransferase with HDIG domain